MLLTSPKNSSTACGRYVKIPGGHQLIRQTGEPRPPFGKTGAVGLSRQVTSMWLGLQRPQACTRSYMQ